jgi:hypothetical protein
VLHGRPGIAESLFVFDYSWSRAAGDLTALLGTSGQLEALDVEGSRGCVSPERSDTANVLFAAACERGLEGVVAKRRP